MKRKLSVILLCLLAVVCIVLVACVDDPTAGGLPTDVPESATEPTLVLHYERQNPDDYLKWGFWIWTDGGEEGQLFKLNYQDDFGGVAMYPLSDFGAERDSLIGIIPRLIASWTKDCDVDRMLDLSQCEMGADNFIHIYLTQGDQNLYKDAEEMKYNVTAAFTAYDKITVNARQEMASVTIFEATQSVAVQNGPAKEIVCALPQNHTLRLAEGYTAEVQFADGKKVTATVDMKALYGTDAFNDAFYFDGELGAMYSATETTFRVWSPVSTKIVLNIYQKGNGEETPVSYDMQSGQKGTFEAVVSGDLAGKYYTYTVYNHVYSTGVEIVDPYAKSAGLDGERGMIVDFSKTNPLGWENVSPIAYDRKQLVVWETHVADVTSSQTWTGTESNRSRFLGLIEEGTTYTEGNVTVKTGFDHIKELGVNAVQLLPIFDQANDESARIFNWGYNPLNYNVLEGSYSSDATDGYTRIKEFKQVVAAFNGAGINIIMDVVYNHVNAAGGSNFDVLMPGYYFRYGANGSMSNGSGCGNETASEHAMFRKFMIDSVCFWASEYKLGGFRFDLMGVHDVETMNMLADALKLINPNIVIYGEPWTGGTSALPSSQQAVQSNANSLRGVGQFNDQLRDALIKGGLAAVTDKGWITNESAVSSSDVSKIMDGLKGITACTNSITDPNKTTNYVTCHDNYTLFDRISAAGITDEAIVKKMAMLANSVVLTSNGTAFMLAGEEFLRTKGGDGNSYQSGYEVNQLDYSLKIAHADMFENYRKLIALKTHCGGLCLSQEQVQQAYKVQSLDGGAVIVIEVTDSENGTMYTIVHANGVAKDVAVNLEGYTLYLDTLGVTQELSSQTEVLPFQTLIAQKAM